MNKTGIDLVLAESFKELATEGPIEKITIKNITDRAGVIRPTFYNHFQDKFELLEWILRTELIDPIGPLIKVGMFKEAMVLLLTNISKDKDFYTSAVKLEGPVTFHMIAMKCVTEALVQIMEEQMTIKRPRYRWMTPEIVATYYAQSMCFAAEEWIKMNLSYSPDEVAEGFMYMITHSMMDVFSDLDEGNDTYTIS